MGEVVAAESWTGGRRVPPLPYGGRTAWLRVRVLPGPPRIGAIAEISWRPAKCPELAGIFAVAESLQRDEGHLGSVLAPRSLPAKSRFPGNGDSVAETRFEWGAHGVESPSIRLAR